MFQVDTAAVDSLAAEDILAKECIAVHKLVALGIPIVVGTVELVVVHTTKVVVPHTRAVDGRRHKLMAAMGTLAVVPIEELRTIEEHI